MTPNVTFDKEKVSFNLAKYKSHGENFEIVVDADKAVEFKELLNAGELEEANFELKDVLKSEKIFSDANRGQLAPENLFMDVFKTEDELEISKIILQEGEIQITSEHRAKIREAKRKQIINIIHRNAIDPRTKAPHPAVRIEAAMVEAKVKIDEFQKAEEQLKVILKKLNVILPMKFDSKQIMVKVFAESAAKMYGFFKKWNATGENWNSDGSLSVTVEIPAGVQSEFFDELNGLTQGNNETQIMN